MRGIGILLIGGILSGTSHAVAVPPTHAQIADPPAELVGRRNPYRPLIVPQSVSSALPAELVPRVKTIPQAPEAVMDRLDYVGIVYDEAEAIAAVSEGERTWFVRLGDRLEGATVTSITPHKLTWNRKGSLIIKHLRREGVR